jgi:hypothetical protein
VGAAKQLLTSSGQDDYKFSETVEIADGASQTRYYFWTYDGEEFSINYSEVTITRNTVPSFTYNDESGTLTIVGA